MTEYNKELSKRYREILMNVTVMLSENKDKVKILEYVHGSLKGKK